MTVIDLDYSPQERQQRLHEASTRQIFYGGAAGGGKSHAMRWDAINFCLQNPGLQAYLFRRSLKELESTHIQRIQIEVPPELATWSESRKAMEFKNGSRINMCYCERDADVFRYLSEEMHWVGLDEASRMTEMMVNFIRTRNRLGGFKANPAYEHALPRFIMASNPGGPGHNFLKRTFIDSAPPETVFFDVSMKNPRNEEDRGWSSIYIPAKIADNEFIDENYEASFMGLPPELARAYAEGDWDAIVGKALEGLSRRRHGLRPFNPPRHWTRFMSIDWGSATPFSVGWYCVSDGAVLNGRGDYPDRIIPSGAIVRYGEYYGWSGRENQGCRLDSGSVAREIKRREKERGEVMDYRVADYQMWAADDGPSVVDNMASAEPTMVFRKSVKDRKANFNEMLARLAGNQFLMDDGQQEQHPMFFITLDCTHFWRTVPVLTLDENDPEKGPDTSLEDHCYDEAVYALRSRPFLMTQRSRLLQETEKYEKEATGGGGDPYSTVSQRRKK